MYFDDAMSHTLMWEGGYVNDPKDKGGETKFGISKRSYPKEDIKNLTLERARQIYFVDYWNTKFDDLNKKLAIKLFDLSVNLGVKRLAMILQETLNTYFGKSLKIDGDIGLKTIEAIKSVNQSSLLVMLIFKTSQFYASLNQPRFLLGWLRRLYS